MDSVPGACIGAEPRVGQRIDPLARPPPETLAAEARRDGNRDRAHGPCPNHDFEPEGERR